MVAPCEGDRRNQTWRKSEQEWGGLAALTRKYLLAGCDLRGMRSEVRGQRLTLQVVHVTLMHFCVPSYLPKPVTELPEAYRGAVGRCCAQHTPQGWHRQHFHRSSGCPQSLPCQCLGWSLGSALHASFLQCRPQKAGTWHPAKAWPSWRMCEPAGGRSWSLLSLPACLSSE